MMRWLVWLTAGALLGGIVHIVTVLALPSAATRDSYSRLAPETAVNAVTLLAQPTPERSLLPFMDPAFATAICRFDLTKGPLKLQVPLTQAYTSITFYTRQGTVFYAINDQAAGRRTIELDFMTSEQRATLPDDEEVTAADRLIVESPSQTGLIALRALAPEPGVLPIVRAALRSARCGPPPP
jgi:uncharacterized membrane protein